ncbi:hypothetical protein ACH0BF_00120 [Pseudobacillus sp. 179-B 2D1 NHS]|uniref:hypothetical protein n=1 Tax=Pseudobacillus sp. 179-B 2D1 NHS TaxID=3374292 RepID=UPI00387A6970
MEAGEYIAPEKIKLGEFIKEWREKYAERNLSDKILYKQWQLIENHISPHLSHPRLDQIKPIHMLNHFDYLSQEGARKDAKPGKLSDATLYEIDKVLRSIFNRAGEWQLIKASSLRNIKRPKVQKKEMNYLDEQEARKVIQALNEMNPTRNKD